MDTIYALVIILSGTLVPNGDTESDILSGAIENKTTVYYRTLEACEKGYSDALTAKVQIALEVPGMEASVEVKKCEAIQVAQ